MLVSVIVTGVLPSVYRYFQVFTTHLSELKRSNSAGWNLKTDTNKTLRVYRNAAFITIDLSLELWKANF